ncbi:uncharacterized protein L203_102780 [Cryptococcus depauperatus CBS 7841]|uniref:Uncharacterized protein n=1 Tax=Cryptococcus depauperatus CBS 7841 TaxID=1295531 RepID=A0AAJ8JSI5_9TREE
MSYTIAGRVIKNEYIVLGTIASTIGIVVAASGGSDKSASSKPVPVSEDKTISGQTPEEEDFIRQFVAEAEKSEKSH